MTDLTWPSNFVPTSSALTWHDNSVTFISPLSGQIRTESRPGGRWTLQLTLDAWKNETDAASGRVSVHELEAFLFKLNGAENRAVIPDHAYAYSGSGATGYTPRIQGAGQTGKTNILSDGWPISTFNILNKGDRVTINDQMLVLTENVNSNGSGVAGLYFHVPLRESPADNEIVYWSEPTARYILKNKVGFSSQPGVFKSVMLEFEEAIP